MHLARGTADSGASVRIAAVLSPQDQLGHPFVERAKASGLTVDVVIADSRSYLAERAQIRSLINAHDIDVVHTHGYRCDAVDGSLAKQLGKAHVTTLHGFTARNWRGHLYEWVQVQAAKRAHHAIAVAPPIEQRLRSAGATRVSLVRNGLDTDRAVPRRAGIRHQLGTSNEVFVIGWVGRLSFEKGPDLFVDALRLLQGSPAFAGAYRAFVVGNGPMLEELRKCSEDLPVEFLGERSDARDLIAGFDTLALTSRTEGTPMVVLEAMAAGTPVVATAVGGVPDVLGDGHGILCQPSASMIAAALERSVGDPESRKRIVERAVTRVREEFGLQQWVERHLRIYENAIGTANGRRD